MKEKAVKERVRQKRLEKERKEQERLKQMEKESTQVFQPKITTYGVDCYGCGGESLSLIHILDIRPEDEKVLKENPSDFLAISYYYTICSSEESMKDYGVNEDGAIMNPHLDASEWGWSIDPLRCV